MGRLYKHNSELKINTYVCIYIYCTPPAPVPTFFSGFVCFWVYMFIIWVAKNAAPGFCQRAVATYIQLRLLRHGCASICVCVYIYIAVRLCVCLSVCLFIDQHTCLPISLSTHPSIHPSIHLFIRLSYDLAIYLSVCLAISSSDPVYACVYLCICLYIYIDTRSTFIYTYTSAHTHRSLSVSRFLKRAFCWTSKPVFLLVAVVAVVAATLGYECPYTQTNSKPGAVIYHILVVE